MKKKLIAFILVFIFSFTMISTTNEKESQAFLGALAGYSIYQIIGGLLMGSTLIAGGYVVGDVLSDDYHGYGDVLWEEYKNYVRDVGIPPGSPEPPPEHELTELENAALLSMMTKQGIEVGSDLYNQLYDYYNSLDAENNIPDDFYSNSNIDTPNNTNLFSYGFTVDYYAGAYVWGATGMSGTLIRKYSLNETDDYFFIEGTLPGGTKQPYFKVISKDNQVITSTNSVNTWLKVLFDDTYMFQFSVNNSTITSEGLFYIPGNTFEPIESQIDQYVEKPDTMIEPENYTPKFVGIDLSELNGLVSSPEEMAGIINGDIEVTPERYKAIEEAWNRVFQDYINNPNFQGLPDQETAPNTDPTTGNLIFGDIPEGPITDPETVPDNLTGLERIIYWLKGIWYAILEIPTGIINGLNKLYNLLSTWLNQFWTKIQEIIDDFWMSFSDWWQDNFIYHWTTFQNWIQNIWQGIPDLLNNIWEWLQGLPVLDISNLLNNIWEWIQGLPDLIYSWFIPEPELIQDTWQPVIDLWNDKLDPVLAPFENLAFYEEELQDVSVNLKFGNYQGTHKIIDYQYIKSVKGSVKSIIRAFFWILIIFFNLDQVHRLIRNQSIINAYVRKIDPPKGRD